MARIDPLDDPDGHPFGPDGWGYFIVGQYTYVTRTEPPIALSVILETYAATGEERRITGQLAFRAFLTRSGVSWS